MEAVTTPTRVSPAQLSKLVSTVLDSYVYPFSKDAMHPEDAMAVVATALEVVTATLESGVITLNKQVPVA